MWRFGECHKGPVVGPGNSPHALLPRRLRRLERLSPIPALGGGPGLSWRARATATHQISRFRSGGTSMLAVSQEEGRPWLLQFRDGAVLALDLAMTATVEPSGPLIRRLAGRNRRRQQSPGKEGQS